jgi:hypothetical protein
VPIRFQVDPDFYDHPKTTGMSDAAFSLWVRAGSFSAAKLTDGFISEDVLAHTLRTDKEVADELARRRLWRRVKGGYRFHEWEHRNLTKTRVEDDRKADRERKRQRRGSGTQTAGQNGNQQADTPFVRPESERNPPGILPESGGIPDGSVSVSVSVSESVSGSGRGARPSNGARPDQLGPRPPETCKEHQDDPDPPACRRCKGAREKAEAWDAAYQLADAERRRTQPQCPRHPGMPAHNCGLCRSERIAAEPAEQEQAA